MYLHVREGAGRSLERLAQRARTREPWLWLCGWLALALAAWLVALRLASPESASESPDALRSLLREDPVPAAALRLPVQLAMSTGAEAASPMDTGASADPFGSDGAGGADGWVAPDGSGVATEGAPSPVPGLPDPDPLGLDAADGAPSIVIDEAAPLEPPAVLRVPVSEEGPALESEPEAGEGATTLPTTAPLSPRPGPVADPAEL